MAAWFAGLWKFRFAYDRRTSIAEWEIGFGWIGLLILLAVWLAS
jgi:hypothetical protein